MIQFFADGLPKGQPRPKATSRGGFTRVYDPGTAEGWKAKIAIAAKQNRPKEPLNGPVEVLFWFYFPRPKFHRRKNGEIKDGAPIWHISKPDCDNAAKAALDALTQLGFWRDDSQVCICSIHKAYENDHRTGCYITIKPK